MPDPVPGMCCPTCAVDLERERIEGASRPTCPRCAGTAVNVALLRRIAPKKRVHAIWYGATRDGTKSQRGCPGCQFPMRTGRVDVDGETVEIDACRRCQLLWFDGTELESFSPERQEPDANAPDPSAVSHARWMERHREQMRERLEKTLERAGRGGSFGMPL
jgi:Zn-finger nucleic acid-binding protein